MEIKKKKKLPTVTQLKLLLIVKNNNEYEWDPMKLESYTISTGILKFL
jgi:hypothetical protein